MGSGARREPRGLSLRPASQPLEAHGAGKVEKSSVWGQQRAAAALRWSPSHLCLHHLGPPGRQDQERAASWTPEEAAAKETHPLFLKRLRNESGPTPSPGLENFSEPLRPGPPFHFSSLPSPDLEFP